MLNNLTDEQLVEEYKNGNEEAFNELYTRYVPVVKFYCRNMFLLGAEPEDLYQEGYRGLINATRSYTSGEVKFKTYSSTCIKNSILDAVKKYSGEKNMALNKSTYLDVLDALGHLFTTPEEKILDKESYDELVLKIYKVLTKEELIILRFFLAGYKYSEIATKIGKTEKAIDGALSRSRKKIANITRED